MPISELVEFWSTKRRLQWTPGEEGAKKAHSEVLVDTDTLRLGRHHREAVHLNFHGEGLVIMIIVTRISFVLHSGKLVRAS